MERTDGLHGNDLPQQRGRVVQVGERGWEIKVAHVHSVDEGWTHEGRTYRCGGVL